MVISEAAALGIIYADFSALLSAGDSESALDLLAVAAVTAKKSPGHAQRITISNHLKSGSLGREYENLGRNMVFEAAIFGFILKATQPLATAICADFGASLSRRRGWLKGWKYLADQDRTCLGSQQIPNFHDFADQALSNPTIKVDDDRFTAEALLVVESITAPESFNPNQPPSATLAASLEGECEYCFEHDCDCEVEDEEDYWNSLESETTIHSEFITFLENSEPHRSLNLLAVCLLLAESVNDDSTDESIHDLLLKSRDIINESCVEASIHEEFYSQFWVTIFNQLALKASLAPLDLPSLEFALASNIDIGSIITNQRQVIDSTITSEPATIAASIKLDTASSSTSSEFRSNNNNSTEVEDGEFKTELFSSADRYLRNVGLITWPLQSLAETAVLESYEIWDKYATVTSEWDDNREVRGYGTKITLEMNSWAQAAATAAYPQPIDSRVSPRKRSRRFYEYVWSWLIFGVILAIIMEAGQLFWWIVGLCAAIGRFLSSNYRSISHPLLTPLHDPVAIERAALHNSLLNIGMHVARQYDNRMFSLNLSFSQLQNLTHGAWQPQGPPPPRLNSCTSRDAEYVAAKWMRFLGAQNCDVTQQTRDGGADVSSNSHLVEVKHHQSPVGVVFIRQIFGVATSQSKKAAFFSLSGYTKSAIQFADENDTCLFQYDPYRATLEPKSISAVAALKYGILGIKPHIP